MLQISYFQKRPLLWKGAPLELPYGKAEDLLYVLSAEKSFPKEQLSSLFWGSMESSKAKKNLRHGIYILRKHLYEELVVSSHREDLQLDPDLPLQSDLCFLQDFNPDPDLSKKQVEEFLDFYQGDFLFWIHGDREMEFSDYLEEKRRRLLSLYKEKLQRLLPLVQARGWDTQTEMLCKKWLALDEYHQQPYRILLQHYQQKGYHDKRAALLMEMEEHFGSRALLRNPKCEITPLESSLPYGTIPSITPSQGAPPFGRSFALQYLEQELHRFQEGENFYSLCLTGETGIGKTRLLQAAQSFFREDTLVLSLPCHEHEGKHPLLFLRRFLKTLEEELAQWPSSMQAIPPSTTLLLKETLQKSASSSKGEDPSSLLLPLKEILDSIVSIRRLVLLMDDIHWMDGHSAALLKDLLVIYNQNMMLVSTLRDEQKNLVQSFVLYLTNRNILKQLTLARLTREETRLMCRSLALDEMDEALYSQVYEASEGHPLFIEIYMEQINQGNPYWISSEKIDALLKERLYLLDSSLRNVVELCAVMLSPYTLLDLAGILQTPAMALVDQVELLLEKHILKESCYEEDVALQFTHQNMQKYLYASMSQMKRMVLHQRIGNYYESLLQGCLSQDLRYYPLLVHHYDRAKNRLGVFRYKLQRLESFFCISHELFPVVRGRDCAFMETYFISEEDFDSLYEELMEDYYQISDRKQKSILNLFLRLLYLYGRFYKDRENGQKGLCALNHLVKMALSNDNEDMAFQGYVQMIHHAINTKDLPQMQEWVDIVWKLAQKSKEDGKIAHALRLRGYAFVLAGNYQKGCSQIQEAQSLYRELNADQCYRLNLAACQFYLGEAFSHQKFFQEAAEFYLQALEYCDEDQDHPAVAVILSHLGMAKLSLGMKQEAQFYFKKSIRTYEKTVFSWGRQETHLALAGLFAEKKEWKEVLHHLKQLENAPTSLSLENAEEVFAKLTSSS